MNKQVMPTARYEEYKDYKEYDVGHVELMIPEHWQTEKCRFVFKFSKGLTITKEHLQEVGIPCVNYGEIHSKFGFEVDPSKHDLKCVDPTYLKHGNGSLLTEGDFVFADTSEDIEGSGNFTYLNSPKPIFAGYHTLIARTKVKVPARFMAYVLDSASFRKQVRKAVKGVKVYSITQAILKNMVVWLPPLPEQTAIAEFLDDKTAKIEALVGIKRRQIELLIERKQILIQNAVTKGLDHDAPMKDSGVDWIGEIPVHWEVKRSKFVFIQRKEMAQPNDVQLSATQAYGVIPQEEYEEKVGRKVVKIQFNLEKRKHVENDDFVISMRSFQGGLERAHASGCIRSSYVILRPSAEVVPLFFGYVLKSPRYILAIQSTASFIRDGQDLNFENFSKVDLFIPPYLEQQEIADYIEDNAKKIDTAITIKQNQITKLNEYKTTLINAVVTGKIKVTGGNHGL